MREHLKRILRKVKQYLRWTRIFLSSVPRCSEVHVFYGHDSTPPTSEILTGGQIKFQRMQTVFPNSARAFNILYLGSSSLPKDWQQLLSIAHQKRIPVIYNQNGVAFPAWREKDWRKVNELVATILKEADHVFYQSLFCKSTADIFLGERKGPWEILYNAVDTTFFTPAPADPDNRPLVLLLGGKQYQKYPVEIAVRTLALLAQQRPDVRLILAGRFAWATSEETAKAEINALTSELRLSDKVEFYGMYTQNEAPNVYRQAHILLHTKCNDPCPGVVVEALSCGLPVVYSETGGVPELVGSEAGIGIPGELDWEKIHPPDPQLLAEAVLRIAERRKQFSQAARERAVHKFDFKPWLQRHKEVFENLLKSGV